MSESCIYRGAVRHRRRTPVENSFNYSAFMLYLDLDELDTVFAARWMRRLWSTSRIAFARFKRSDHLKQVPVETSLKDAVKEMLVKHGIDAKIGKIGLLTQVRYLGFEMNPVSFYYCYGEDTQRVEAVIAEVNNTPWGEQHIYVVPSEPSKSSGDQQKRVVADRVSKDFHVSPFMEMDQEYRMLFSIPGDSLGVKMQNFEDGERIFDVSMLLNHVPMTSANLNWMLVRFPLMSMKIFAGIYWQAAKLWWKGCPFVSHPVKQDSTTNETTVNTSKSNAESVWVSR